MNATEVPMADPAADSAAEPAGGEAEEAVARICHICFVDGGEWLQGRVVELSEERGSSQIGLFGERRDIPDTFHRCLYDPADPPEFYRITVTQFRTGAEWVADAVMKTCGDNAKLESDEIAFDTGIFMVDDEAQEYVRKYFPKLVGREVIVCEGEITLTPPEEGKKLGGGTQQPTSSAHVHSAGCAHTHKQARPPSKAVAEVVQPTWSDDDL